MGRLTVVAVVGLAVLLAASPAGARAASPARIAEALAADPVYVDRQADPALAPGDAGRVRLRIVDKALGRIKIAVLAPRDVARSGGLANVANAIDRELRPRGALIATAGTGWHVVTSHPGSSEAAAAVRTAVQTHRSLPGRLIAAVDGVAAADPGPGADLNAGAGSGTAPADGFVEDGTDELFGAFKLGVLVVAAAVALPFVVVALLLLLRARRGRAREAERLVALRERAHDELVALGDTVRELELDASLNRSGRAEHDRAVALYEQAVALYNQANDLLCDEEPSELRLAEARQAIAEGQRRMSAARALFSAAATDPAR